MTVIGEYMRKGAAEFIVKDLDDRFLSSFAKAQLESQRIKDWQEICDRLDNAAELFVKNLIEKDDVPRGT